ncbi:MAG: acyl-CoA dehydrogenase family protein [Beijerinckiaceae bacterium]
MTLHSVDLDGSEEQVGASRVRASIRSEKDALDAVGNLAELIRKHSRAAREERRLHAGTIEALSGVGLFDLMTPLKYGGSELGLGTLVSTTARIAECCGSTAWVFQVFAGHNWLISLFADEAQAEIFQSTNPLSASCTRAVGDIRREGGGVSLHGVRGRFCSGIDHAGWIVLVARIEEGDGNTAPGIIIVPQSSAEIIDDWHTSGMRGTGSKSFSIEELFVPGHRVLSMKTIASGQAPGLASLDAAIYRAPFPQILPLQLAGAPLGLAKAAVKVFVDAKAEKLGAASEVELAEQTPTYLLVSDVSAEIDAAFALVQADCDLIDNVGAPESLTPLNRARYIRNVSHAIQKCRAAVNRLYEASGGSAIYATHGLNSIWCDINAGAAHAAFQTERGGTMYGREILGLPPSPSFRIGQ